MVRQNLPIIKEKIPALEDQQASVSQSRESRNKSIAANTIKKKIKRKLLHIITAIEEKVNEREQRKNTSFIAPSQKVKSPSSRKEKSIVGKRITSIFTAGTIAAATLAGAGQHIVREANQHLQSEKAPSRQLVDFNIKSAKLKADTNKALSDALHYGPANSKDFDTIYRVLSQRFSKKNMESYAYAKADRLANPRINADENKILKQFYRGFLDVLEETYGEPFLYLLSTVKAESNFKKVSSTYKGKELATGYYQIRKIFTQYHELLNDPVTSNLAGYDYVLSLLSIFAIGLIEKKDENAEAINSNEHSKYINNIIQKTYTNPTSLSVNERHDVILYVSASSNMGIKGLFRSKGVLPEETKRHMKKYASMMETLAPLGQEHVERMLFIKKLLGKYGEKNIEDLVSKK